jgi:hypothetical protein
MAAGEKEGDRSRPLYVEVALVLWPSFLAAGVACALFFDAVDPELLRDAGPRIFDSLSREAGYALGFLFFWAVGALASTLTIYLVRTDRHHGSDDGESRQ